MLAVLLFITAGPLLWGLHLTIVYMAHTAVCALAASPGAETAILAIVTVALAVLLMLILLDQQRFARLLKVSQEIAERGSYDRIAFFLNLLSLAGILWSGLAVTILSSCAPGR